MIAVDTNILVYAHRRDSEWHDKAFTTIRKLAEDKTPWIISSHAIIEFYAIVTHPRIYNPPSTPLEAKNQINAWLESPSLILAHSTKESLIEIINQSIKLKTRGPNIHDLRLAYDCMFYGATEIYSADRDFSKVTFLKITNPLVRENF